jgi:methyl-accepting chemotaxis protein
MDQVTQQNAALVEQMAAAASSLKAQAGDLVGVVSQFKLDANVQPVVARSTSAPRHVPAAIGQRPVAPRLTSSPKKLTSPKAAAPRVAAPKPAPAKPLPKPQAKPAPAPAAGGNDDWETF